MMGLIWLVQLSHYPAFDFFSEKDFKKFHDFHLKETTWAVIFAMVLELGSGLLLFFRYQEIPLSLKMTIIINFCVIGTWISTFVFSVPIHNQLNIKKTSKLIKKLVTTNWPRTILWTLKSLILFMIVLDLLGER